MPSAHDQARPGRLPTGWGRGLPANRQNSRGFSTLSPAGHLAVTLGLVLHARAALPHAPSRDDGWRNDFNAYAVYTNLNLYSNFSGFVDPRGDQIKQREARVLAGGDGEHTRSIRPFGLEMDNSVGVQVRHDENLDSRLNSTREREVLDPVRRMISAGAMVDLSHGFFATLRVRHFGDVPLNESNTANAGDVTLVNAGAGYRHDPVSREVDVFNLLDSRASDIAYDYESRTRDELNRGLPPVEGVLKHPVEPRMVRVTATVTF